MPYSTCVRCANCDGFPCPCTRKSDAEVLGVRPALEHANVTLLTNAQAVKLETNDAGTAVTERGRRARRRDGDALGATSSSSPAARPTPPSCCSRSASDKHPNGLANGSDQVGRNYMFHDSQAVLALSREENPTVFQKTLGLNDFYFGADDFDYPMGNIQMIGKSQAPMFRGEKPLRDEARARVDAREDGAARGRLLAVDRGPARARTTGSPSTATATSS